MKKKIPSPLINEIKLAKIKRLPLSGLWEAHVVDALSQLGSEDCPKEDRNKGMIAIVKSAGRFMLHTKAFQNFPDQVNEAMENLLDSILEFGSYPAYINVKDELTKSFLSGLCGKLGISISLVQDLPALSEAGFEIYTAMGIDLPEEDEYDEDDEAFDEFMSDLTDDDVEYYAAVLSSLTNHQLVGIPYAHRACMALAFHHEKFPLDLARRCWKVFDSTFEEVDDECIQHVYKIRFTLEPDQYFDVEISGAENLLCLSTAVRFPFYADVGEYRDLVNLPDGTSYDLSKKSGAMKVLHRLNLKKGSTFSYVMKVKLEDENVTKRITFNLDCKVLSVKKTENPPIEPVFGAYVGFDRDPDKESGSDI